MNPSAVNIAVVDGKTITQTQELRSAKLGEPVRIKAVRGGSYILAEGDKGVAPENITVKRVGKDLHVSLEGTDLDQPQLIIEDFYGSDSQLVGMAEDGSYHEYVSSDADLDHEAAFLMDGDSSAQALGSEQLLGYGNGLTYGSGLMGAGMNFMPALLGLGGLALAGAAYAVGKNKDDGGHDAVVVPGGPSTPVIGSVHDSVGSVQGPIENGGSTDDTQPTFTGTGTPGNTVIIKDNGLVIGEVEIGADGNWDFTPATPLPEGAHSIVVAEKDSTGAISAPSAGFDLIVDTVAPGKSVISGVIDDVGEIQGPVLNGGFTDDNRPTLNGTGEEHARIDIYANGEKIGETTVGIGGSWTFTPEAALADGQYVFTSVAVDAAGNAGLPSDPHTITIDTIAPDKGVIGEVVDDAGLIIGDGDATDDATPTFGGDGLVPGDTVIIKDNGEIIGTAPVKDDGSWTWTPGDDLAEGDHSVIIIIRDPAGNESDPSDPVDFVVDLTAPVMPGDGAIGPGGAFEGAWDNVGPITGEIEPGTETDDPRPEFKGVGLEPGDTVIIKDNGEIIGTAPVKDDGSWSWIPDTDLAEGDHSVIIVIRDPAGNDSDPSDSLDFGVDLTPPVMPGGGAIGPGGAFEGAWDDVGPITGEIEPGTETDDPRPEFKGEGLVPGDTVIIKDNGEIIGTAPVKDDGSWSWIPDTDLAEGDHSVIIVIRDPAGNDSDPSDSLDFGVDLTPPVMPGGGAIGPGGAFEGAWDDVGPITGEIEPGTETDDPRPEFKGEGLVPGDTVIIKDNGEIIGTAPVKDDGSWTWTPDTDLAEGDHSVIIVIRDPAGNESDPSDSLDFGVDLTPPVMPGGGAIGPGGAFEGAWDDVGPITGEIDPGTETDDPRPEFKGEGLVPGDTVIIKDNGEIIGTAPVKADGSWTWTPDTDLAEGDHSVIIVIRDPAGNESDPSDSLDFGVDLTPPVMPGGGAIGPGGAFEGAWDDVGPITGEIDPGTETDDPRPEFKGEGLVPGDTVIIKDNGEIIGTAPVKDDGSWTWTPDTDLAEGDHSVIIVIRDPAGNESDPSDSLDFSVDLTAPTQPTIESVFDDQGSQQGNLAPGDITDDARPTISGKAEPESIVIIYDNGREIGRVRASDTGNWDFEPTLPLANGTHNLTVKAMDAAGNLSDPSDGFNFDLVAGGAPAAPAISGITDSVGDIVGNLMPNAVTDDAKPTIHGTGQVGSTISIYANGVLLGTTSVGAGGLWDFTPTSDLAEGLNNISAVAKNSAGNDSPSTGNYPITVDTIAPGAAVVDELTDNVGDIKGPISNGDTTDDSTPTFNGTAEPLSTVIIYDNGAEIGRTRVLGDGSWTFSPSPVLADGPHSLSTEVVDAAGNRSGQSAPIEFTVDTRDVEISIDYIADNEGTKQGPLSSGSVTDDSTPTLHGRATASASVNIYLDGVLQGSAQVASDGTWEFTPSPALADGNYNFTATVVTDAGGESLPTAGFNLVIDTVAPGKPTIGEVSDAVGDTQGPIENGGHTDDAHPTLSGNGLDFGDTVYIYDNGDLIGTVKVGVGGNWSFTPDPGLNDGTHEFTIRAEDEAGNPSLVSDPYSVIIDTTAPTKPTIDSVFDDQGAQQGNLEPGDITDDTRPTISGKAERFSTVIIYDKESEIGRTQAKEDGTWTFEPTTPLANGEHDLTVKAMDAADNISDASDSFEFVINVSTPATPTITQVIDDQGEEVGPIGSGEITDDTQPVVHGTAESGVFIIVYDGAIEVGRTEADEHGDWFLTLPELNSGSHDITAVALSDVGSPSAPSNNFNFKVGSTWDFNDGTLQGWIPEGRYGEAAWNNIRDGRFNAGTGGANTWDTPVMSIEVAVVAGKIYDFSFMVGVDVASNFSLIGFTVDGKQIGDIITVTAGSHSFHESFTAAETGTVKLAIINNNSGTWGNDFWLDNLAFAPNEFGGPVVAPLATAVTPSESAEASSVLGDDIFGVLVLSGAEQVFDLNSIVIKEDGPKVIDITGEGDNTLKLSLDDVLNHGEANLFHDSDKVQMMVKGDAGDVVDLSNLIGDTDPGSWAAQGQVVVAGVTYEVYQHSGLGAELLVQDGVTTNLV